MVKRKNLLCATASESSETQWLGIECREGKEHCVTQDGRADPSLRKCLLLIASAPVSLREKDQEISLMATTKSEFIFGLIAMLVAGSTFETCLATDTKVAFDIPSKVECRDVTPEKCAAVHTTMKVIEAKFRISASFVDGEEASTVDFVYMISSPDMRLKVLDFLPNTTLESSTAEGHIEVTDSTESTDALTGDARVAYSILSLGASKNLSNKKTESNHYQRVAPKHLVLASGTVNRGNGVFYKLRPSEGGSLEGAKEFVLMAIVPKKWRGDWCTVICSARTHKKSAVSNSISITGIEQAHVGLYLAGDTEASELAESLTQVQLAHGGLLSKQLTKEATHTVEALHSIPPNRESKGLNGDWLFKAVKFKPVTKHGTLEVSKTSLLEIESRFGELSGTSDGFR